jgi:6-pyruvoyltetrahydropterin/6-carboxytetrahydropterin synthase
MKDFQPFKTKAVRRIQFCSGHRVFRHESKCANFHGHNYVAFFHAEAKNGLDSVGRVIDFSELKTKLGGWIDVHWDHTMVLFKDDLDAVKSTQNLSGSNKPIYLLDSNPTAENMAHHLLFDIAPKLFQDSDIEIVKVVLFETENCFAEVAIES